MLLDLENRVGSDVETLQLEAKGLNEELDIKHLWECENRRVP